MDVPTDRVFNVTQQQDVTRPISSSANNLGKDNKQDFSKDEARSDKFDSSSEISSEMIIRLFDEERQKIINRGKDCRDLLDYTDSVLKNIHALRDLHRYISPKTSQLHSECRTIIQERTDLKESYDRITTTLSRQEEIRGIIRRMPAIKAQIISTLNSVCQTYADRLQQQQQSETVNQLDTLDEYYGRFYIECRRIKEYTSQLESCLLAAETSELLLYLEEIYTLYFDVREQIIEPVFLRQLNGLIANAARNYCDLFRQACLLLVRVLRNEIQLFNQIFPTDLSSPPIPSAVVAALAASRASPRSSVSSPVTGAPVSSNKQDLSSPGNPKRSIADGGSAASQKQQSISAYLEMLCRLFYERLRPVVIHVNHLETLAELHKLITENMMSEVAEQCYEATMKSLVEDIQERLIFRVEIFVQESVLDYKPSSGDLAYPEKLEFLGNGHLRDYQSMWYPSVQRTVSALFYLERVFDPVTFAGLAQEVLSACFKSLDIAQRLVDERHGGTKIEANLFLSKHLEVLRDQLQVYGIEPSLVETEQLSCGECIAIIWDQISRQSGAQSSKAERPH